MSLILASYDEYILINGKNLEYEENIEKILIKEKYIFKHLINYWCLDNYDLEGSFYITPFIKNIRDKIYK